MCMRSVLIYIWPCTAAALRYRKLLLVGKASPAARRALNKYNNPSANIANYICCANNQYIRAYCWSRLIMLPLPLTVAWNINNKYTPRRITPTRLTRARVAIIREQVVKIQCYNGQTTSRLEPRPVIIMLRGLLRARVRRYIQHRHKIK